MIDPSTTLANFLQRKFIFTFENCFYFRLPINVFANSKQPQQNSNTQDRQSRPRENAAKTPLVPHLYAEQRVRNRSLSRDPQRPSKGSNTPSTANKELKKIVAFGRTTTVEVISY